MKATLYQPALLVAACLLLAVYVPHVKGDECLDMVGSLQSSCSTEIAAASKFFGVTVTGDATTDAAALASADASKIDEFLSNKDNTPTPGCCTVASDFNTKKCNCDKDVLDIIGSVVDMGLYTKTVDAFGKSCTPPFSPIIGGSCPKP